MLQPLVVLVAIEVNIYVSKVTYLPPYFIMTQNLEYDCHRNHNHFQL